MKAEGEALQVAGLKLNSQRSWYNSIRMSFSSAPVRRTGS